MSPDHRSVDADVWLCQTSKVIFKRKGAAYGLYQDVAVANCDTLINDPEKFVQTVLGWCAVDKRPYRLAQKRDRKLCDLASKTGRQ